jgi:hypothetical protein
VLSAENISCLSKIISYKNLGRALDLYISYKDFRELFRILSKGEIKIKCLEFGGISQINDNISK